MFILVLLSIILLFVIVYKTNIISDLEIRNGRLRRLQIAEVMDILNDLKDSSNLMILDKKIDTYMQKYEGIKKELNINFERGNV